MRRAWGTLAVITLAMGGAVLPAASAAAADRPDNFSTAKHAAVSPLDTWISERLSNAGDRDWFRFSLASDQRALVTLGSLPANYRLQVYDASGSLVATSNRAGRRFEELYLPLKKGNNFVRVTAAGSSVDPKSNYVLKFRGLRNAVVFAERKVHFTNSEFLARGELLNNTAHKVSVHRLHVVFRDKNGKKVSETDEGVRPGPVAARHRVEFEIQRSVGNAPTDVPSSATSYTLTVEAGSTTEAVQRGIVMTPGAVKVVSPTSRIYSGTIKNVTNQKITDVYPTIIEYDARGRANLFAYGHVKSIGPGETRSYSASTPHEGIGAPNSTRQYPTIINGLT